MLPTSDVDNSSTFGDEYDNSPAFGDEYGNSPTYVLYIVMALIMSCGALILLGVCYKKWKINTDSQVGKNGRRNRKLMRYSPSKKMSNIVLQQQPSPELIPGVSQESPHSKQEPQNLRKKPTSDFFDAYAACLFGPKKNLQGNFDAASPIRRDEQKSVASAQPNVEDENLSKAVWFDVKKESSDERPELVPEKHSRVKRPRGQHRSERSTHWSTTSHASAPASHRSTTNHASAADYRRPRRGQYTSYRMAQDQRPQFTAVRNLRRAGTY